MWHLQGFGIQKQSFITRSVSQRKYLCSILLSKKSLYTKLRTYITYTFQIWGNEEHENSVFEAPSHNDKIL